MVGPELGYYVKSGDLFQRTNTTKIQLSVLA